VDLAQGIYSIGAARVPKPSTGKMLGIAFGSMVVLVMLFMMVAVLVERTVYR
jgi:hypothetical protein